MFPEGWQQSTIGEVLCEHEYRCENRTDLMALSLTKANGLVLAKERFGRTLHSKDVSRYRICRKDDIVVDPMLLWDGAIARLWRYSEGFVSPDYRVFSSTGKADPLFLDYLFQSHYIRTAFKNGARGTNKRRNRIARSDFLQIQFPLPPLPEQKKIADILSCVDEAIASTQAVIDQTRKVKQGLLQQLLTRGIGHTKFKESAIGKIPETWEVKPLQEIAIVQTGLAKGKKVQGNSVELPYLREASKLKI
jgi:type I restriction enzyme S subunit